ncbi:MAG: hypothetical protein L0Y72_17745 [Gemmataceae bacterium]|nr:hypothetical protein [Gemmataceae bacterium]
MVKLPEGFSVPVPLNLPPEREAEMLAQYRADLDPDKLEAEFRELLKLEEEGKLISFEEVLRQLGWQEEEDRKESA